MVTAQTEALSTAIGELTDNELLIPPPPYEEEKPPPVGNPLFYGKRNLHFWQYSRFDPTHGRQERPASERLHSDAYLGNSAIVSLRRAPLQSSSPYSYACSAIPGYGVNNMQYTASSSAYSGGVSQYLGTSQGWQESSYSQYRDASPGLQGSSADIQLQDGPEGSRGSSTSGHSPFASLSSQPTVESRTNIRQANYWPTRRRGQKRNKGWDTDESDSSSEDENLHFRAPGERIDGDVLIMFVREFIGTKAEIRSSTHPTDRSREGRNICTKRFQIPEHMRALINDTKDWERERNSTNFKMSPYTYANSDTWQRRKRAECAQKSQRPRHDSGGRSL